MKFNRKQRTERSKTLNLSGNLNKKPPKNCSFFYKIAGHRSILQHSGPSTIMFIIIISFIPTAYDSFIELLSVQKTLHSHTLIFAIFISKTISWAWQKMGDFLVLSDVGVGLDQTKPACSKSSPVLEVLPIRWRQCPPLYYVPCEMMDCDRPMDS